MLQQEQSSLTIITLSLALLLTGCTAHPGTDNAIRPSGGVIRPVPNGSYLLTCSEVKWGERVSPTFLAAKCIKIDESQIYTGLDVAGCNGDIANMDGELSCPKGDTPPPPGSYLMTSRHIVTKSGAIASAQCLRIDGRWQVSSHSGHCGYGQDLANLNGTLTCNPPNK